MKDQWLSAHIFYAEPFEFLLTNGLKPFFERLHLEAKIKRYFFIRYREKGPHIRIRIMGEPEFLGKSVKPLLLSTFTDFMKKFPSERIDPPWVKKLPPDKIWYPNNSVQFINYEPETERYGGKHIICLAEEHFQQSSDTVLHIINKENTCTYDQALSAALQMHLAFASAIGLDVPQTKKFYSQIYASWLLHAYQSLNYVSKIKRQNVQEQVLAAFKIAFEKQENSLVPFINSFWQLLKSGHQFEDSWLNEWIIKVKETDTKIKIKQREGKLLTNYSLQTAKISEKIGKDMMSRWSIYYSFIHMTNNRLGIQNRDEGYLGYLLMEALRNEDK